MAGLITKFIEDNPEDGDHNQYWYSESTIAAIIRDQVDQYEIAGSPAGGLTIAFLSTPSLYYSLPEALRQNSYLFDFGALIQFITHFLKLSYGKAKFLG